MAHGKLADPAVIGPGYWAALHTMAAMSTTPELERAFPLYVRGFAERFKCEKCRRHFLDYLAKHPIEPYLGRRDSFGTKIGAFLWTWEFHNHANRFLGKCQPTFEEAFAFYGGGDAGVCTDCGAGGPAAQPTPAAAAFPAARRFAPVAAPAPPQAAGAPHPAADYAPLQALSLPPNFALLGGAGQMPWLSGLPAAPEAGSADAFRAARKPPTKR